MSTYRTIHTTFGLAAMAAAEADNIPINLTHMAVGDGNGNPVTPEESQSTLVREMWRGTVNRVYQDAVTQNQFTAELIVPSNVGGFVLREVGLFDANGTLFAVGNLPDTYKPVVAEGAVADTVVRMVFLVTNASVVTINLDPNIAVASQSWVLNAIDSAHVLPGGTTGQVLRKASNNPGDVLWVTPDVAESVIVDAIEERQTLAENQTVVVLATTTTDGLAVYVDGHRKPRGAGANAWEPDAQTPDTTLVLGSSYPAGTEILLVQNEPHGNIEFTLIQENNLADLPSVAAARGNLDVYSKAEADTLAPAGMVGWFAQATAPVGWLKANGAAVSRTAYSRLYSAIGDQYGAGDGINTFNLPDLRGEFLRGLDDGRGIDPGRAIGSLQMDANKQHSHTASSGSTGTHSHNVTIDSAGTHAHIGTALNNGTHNHEANAATSADHTHSASTAAAGSHGHMFTYERFTQVAGGSLNPRGFGAGNKDTSLGFFADNTLVGAAGSHTHTVTVNPGGSHSHLVAVTQGGLHNHSIIADPAGAHSHAGSTAATGAHAHSVTVGLSGDGESRPRNVALLACIRY